MTDGNAAAAAPAPERRVAARATADDLPWPLTCRITPGREVRVLNLSASGVLVESRSALSPGRIVTLHLHAPARRLAVTMTGLIVRSTMTEVDRERGAMFASAIAFERRCDLLPE